MANQLLVVWPDATSASHAGCIPAERSAVCALCTVCAFYRTVRAAAQRLCGSPADAASIPCCSYAFVHYYSPDDAAAAIAALDGQVVPQLNPAVPLRASYRDQGSGSSGGGGSGKAGPGPRKGSGGGGGGGGHPISSDPTSKLFVAHIEEWVTVKDLEAVFGRQAVLSGVAWASGLSAPRRCAGPRLSFRCCLQHCLPTLFKGCAWSQLPCTLPCILSQVWPCVWIGAAAGQRRGAHGSVGEAACACGLAPPPPSSCRTCHCWALPLHTTLHHLCHALPACCATLSRPALLPALPGVCQLPAQAGRPGGL